MSVGVDLASGGSSALDHPHLLLVVVVADGGGEIVELVDLSGSQLDAVSSGVLLDAGDPLGTGDRGDVVSLSQDPRQGDLSRGGADLGCDRLDLVDSAQVALEVLAN